MEIAQLSVVLLFSFLHFLFMISRNKKTISIYHLPPGPRKLPIIGNLHQLIGSLPHQCLKDLSKKYGPIMHLQLGEVSALVISSPEKAKEVMKNQDITFANRPMILSIEMIFYNGTNIAFSPYGEYWRQLRKICTLELLSSKRVQSYRSLREDEVTSLIKSVYSSAGAPINLSKMVLRFTNNVTCRAAFSDKCEDEDEFILAMQEIVKLSAGFELLDLFPSYRFLHRFSREKSALKKAKVKVDRILDKIIDGHKIRRGRKSISNKGSCQDDLINVILNIQENSDLEVPITKDNIKAVILDIFAAGTETSSATIEWAMSELIKKPQIMKKAQAEARHFLKGKGKLVDETDIQDMNYLKSVIKETLRFHPPAPLLLPRESRENCKIDHYDIPTKTKVIVNAWAMGRDPRYWVNPECFEPDRFTGSPIDFKGTSFEYIPFGAGRRMCPGISFGIANIELSLAQLLCTALPNGTKPEELDMSEAYGLIMKRENDLIVIANPSAP